MDPGVYSIRAARENDAPYILTLIREMAKFEKLEDQVSLTAADLMRDGFGSETFYQCLVAEQKGQSSLVGYSLFYNVYSTFRGRSMYMEDLYVSPAHRGNRLGTALWKAVAKIAVDKLCTRLDFVVLDWNKKAIDLYRSRGALDMTSEEGWHLFRMQGQALTDLAQL